LRIYCEPRGSGRISDTTCAAGKAGRATIVEKYLDDTGRQREWPTKTVLRKRSELREFLEIVGDIPVNAYRQVDGVNFKDSWRYQSIVKGRPSRD